MAENTWFDAFKESVGDPELLDRERLIVEVTETIAKLMNEQDISKSELASKLNRKPAFITKLLNGKNNFTLGTLSKIFLSLDKCLHVSYTNKDDCVRISCGTEFDVPNVSSRQIYLPRSVSHHSQLAERFDENYAFTAIAA